MSKAGSWQRLGQAPCGHHLDSLPNERWKDEIVCYSVGCKACKYHRADDTIHVEPNIPKVVGLWVKHQKGT